MSEVYPGPCQTSKMKRFVKTVNNFWPLAITAQHSILDIWQGSEYAPAMIELSLSSPWFLEKVVPDLYFCFFLFFYQSCEVVRIL